MLARQTPVPRGVLCATGTCRTKDLANRVRLRPTPTRRRSRTSPAAWARRHATGSGTAVPKHRPDTELAALPISPIDQGRLGDARQSPGWDVVLHEPQRQKEIYGWTTPDSRFPGAVAAFEAAKSAYWAKVCDESLFHLRVLKETADFPTPTICCACCTSPGRCRSGCAGGRLAGRRRP